ncbi:MAG TPA: DUF1289 domain-containing protein [Gammaproteobacteria bacterium]|nr:DUF1289 domain-containing protein [Gammaproteobacteria bacterium]
MSDSVASPCVSICCLDEVNICIGCGRTLDEIRRWSDMLEQEKRETLRHSADRCAARQRRYPSLNPR